MVVALPIVGGPVGAFAGGAAALGRPDYTLRIQPATLEIGSGVSIKTVAYNGQIPGPLLRLKEGVPVTIDVTNGSANEDIVHWHGLTVDTVSDGAAEEGSPMIAAGKTLRYSFTPKPAGTRWYHSHAMAMDDLNLAGYTGQYGFLLVEGGGAKPQVDLEVNLALHHWEPSFVPMVETMRKESANIPQTCGSDVGYRYATFNGHMLGAGEPIRVRQGQRVLFRLLNASATENTVLALPGHKFRVIAMDGNPVPNPKSVEVLSLAVAERVDAIVEMNSPGVWVLGSTVGAERAKGLGVVIEYAGSAGKPVWRDPEAMEWDYIQFAADKPVPEPAETFTLTFRDAGALSGSKFDTWTINGDAWPKVKPMIIERGKRYRMLFRNASGDQHPMHLHRHSFEVTRIGDRSLSGLIKDTINVMPLQTVAVDFLADNPGDSLVHCHQQLHMDYGFMQMFKYRA
jgi:FtsP/CotA-like multicopper oxidase with cupredoxin domain